MKCTSLMLALLLYVSVFSADSESDSLPHVFAAGDTARASSVNENFTWLLNHLQQVKSRIDSLETVTASLEDSLAGIKESFQENANRISDLESTTGELDDSLTSVRTSLQLPIGTIIGSMLSPDEFAEQFPDDSSCWKLADSSQASAAFFEATGNSNIPDLRGVFLRGVNDGRTGNLADPDGDRAAGSFQVDIFGAHGHTLRQYSAAGISDGGWGIFDNTNRLYTQSSTSTVGGDETRPRNVAVYWYIKVK